MGGPDSGPWLWLFKGLRPGAGNAGSIFCWVPSQNTQNDHIWPKLRSAVLEGFTPNVTTSGPNPWFWAQNHGFGPDVVIFSLTPPVPSHHKAHEKNKKAAA